MKTNLCLGSPIPSPPSSPTCFLLHKPPPLASNTITAHKYMYYILGEHPSRLPSPSLHTIYLVSASIVRKLWRIVAVAQPQQLLYEYASLFHFAEINYSLKVNYASYVLLLLPLLLGDPLYMWVTHSNNGRAKPAKDCAHHCQLPADKYIIYTYLYIIHTYVIYVYIKKNIGDEQRERETRNYFC